MFNVFQRFRDLGFDPKNDSLIRFSAPEHHSTSGFCEYPEIIGSPPTALIDGDNNTAWANLNEKSDEQYVIMEFRFASIQIQNFTFYSLCSPPKDLSIEGRNKNTEKWESVCFYNTSINSNTITTFPCHNLRSFRFIKISQSMAANTARRLHIHHIEIFGKFIFKQTSSLRYFQIRFSFAFISLTFSK